MLKYTYKVNDIYKLLNVYKESGTVTQVVAMIFYWYGLSSSQRTSSVEIQVPLSLEELNEINGILHRNGMPTI